MTAMQERRLNGVDTETLFATIGAVREQPELARFRFHTVTDWVDATHSQGRFAGFHGAGQDHTHETDVVVPADHPAVLVGQDRGPTPAELLLSALGACLTAGIGNIAAARGIELRNVRCDVEGDIDLRGLLGIDAAVRNGFDNIRVTFTVDGDAEAEKLADLVAQSRNRSAVFDVLTRGTSVAIDVRAR